jgi:flagellar basal body-associated protein FliL
MDTVTKYDSSLPLREKVLYVLSILKKESINELSVEIMELDGLSTEEGVSELTIEIEREINRLHEEGVVTKVKEHRQKTRYILSESKA